MHTLISIWIYIYMYRLTYFMSVVSFYTPENIKKPKVFWYFQGVQKETGSMKLVKDFKKIFSAFCYTLYNSRKQISSISYLGIALPRYWLSKITILKTRKIDFFTASLNRNWHSRPLSTYAKFCEKLTFLTPWYAHVRVRTCAYLGVRNVSFSKNLE